MQAMSTSVNLHGADGDECGQHGAEGDDFFCMCNVPGICCHECSLQNLWASLVMSWTAGNSLWSNLNVAL